MKKHLDKILTAICMLLAVAALVITFTAPFAVVKSNIKAKEIDKEYNGSISFSWVDLYLGAEAENAKVTFDEGNGRHGDIIAEDVIISEILTDMETLEVTEREDISVFAESPAEITPIVFIIFAIVLYGIMAILHSGKWGFSWGFGFGVLALCSGFMFVFAAGLSKPIEIVLTYPSILNMFEQSYTVSLGWGAIAAAVCACVAGLLGIAAGALKVVQYKKQKELLLQQQN